MADDNVARPGAGTWYPVVVLAPGQLVSWGTLYYGITFLAAPMQADTGWALSSIFGAFSAGLVLAAVLAPVAGEGITRLGARRCLTGGSAGAAIALVIIACSTSLPMFWAGWLLAGAAMAVTLYEAAFAALRETSGPMFRRNVGALALVGGLASTLFWPASAWLVTAMDWRTVLLVFAVLHLVVVMPLHALLPPRRQFRSEATPRPEQSADHPPARNRLPVAVLFAVAFGLAALLAGAVSAHIALLLSGRGVEQELILLVASLIGPMQVLGRLADLALYRLIGIRVLGVLALGAPTVALAALVVGSTAAWVVAFAVLYGVGQGLLTIVRAMVPNLLTGAADYARMNGWLSAPPLLGRALAPVAVAAVIESAGVPAVLGMLMVAGVVSVALFVIALAVLGSGTWTPGRARRPCCTRNRPLGTDAGRGGRGKRLEGDSAPAHNGGHRSVDTQ